MAKGSKFTNDYKKEIVRLITELGKKPSEVAEDIGVTATTVRRWVKQFSIHGDDAFPGKVTSAPLMLEKENFKKKFKT